MVGVGFVFGAERLFPIPAFVLVNNSGAPIVLLTLVAADADGYDLNAHGWERGLRIPHGSRTNLLGLALGETWRIQLEIGRCRLWYSVPDAHALNLSFSNDTIVQLEPDERLYAVARRDSRRESYWVVQGDGFPVAPARHRCWDADGTWIQVQRSHAEPNT
jgi:hypothetical protein